MPLKNTDVVIEKYEDDYPTNLNDVLNIKFNLYLMGYYYLFLSICFRKNYMLVCIWKEFLWDY